MKVKPAHEGETDSEIFLFSFGKNNAISRLEASAFVLIGHLSQKKLGCFNHARPGLS
jgi:hypothetical protein